MQSYKAMVDEILDDINSHNSDDLKRRVPKLIQKFYFKICKKISWAPLRKEIELDFTTDTTNLGIQLPSDLFGIDRIYDEDNKVEFIVRDSSEVLPDEPCYRAYQTYPSVDPLLTYDDLIINSGAATFLSASLSAYVALGNDVTSEYIKIAGEPGYYKITNNVSPFTLENAYYGKAQVQADFQVRPIETTRLFIVDPSENKLSDRTVKVFYWSAPRPLYKDTDSIIFPDATILKLSVIRELPEAKKRRPVSQKEMEEAMGEAKKQNPQSPATQAPRDKNNNLFTMNNKNLFTTRS